MRRYDEKTNNRAGNRSLRELHYHLDLSHRLGFLSNQDSSLIEAKIVEAEKVLNALIRSLRSK
ncbi:MAG: hypothetical protein CVU54_17330 [Deltaproteobacteria bacterium HGW-Deltaproteobacteria-12]|nr:MAG: hypothetical protein CVU54_17330 [Deltaproteobacteria bacterium HGW-Deltaproteobacteria-12]